MGSLFDFVISKITSAQTKMKQIVVIVYVYLKNENERS